MAFQDDLQDLIDKETQMTGASAKMARFSYEQSAYDNDTMDGVAAFDENAAQNIPLGSSETYLDVNSTVVDKGLRSDAAVFPRNLANHFFGRASYNLNKIHDWMKDLLTKLKGALGAANGIATLDADGKIPSSQMREAGFGFTYVIDSQAKFNDWENNAAGNDYTSVAVCAGTYTQTKKISASAQGTKFVKGFGASITANLSGADNNACFSGIAMIETLDIVGFSVSGISGTTAYAFIQCGLRDIRINISYSSYVNFRAAYQCGGEYGTIISGIDINITARTSNSIYGLHSCSNISDARIIISNSLQGYAYAFLSCIHLSNCAGSAINTSSYAFGNCFTSCNFLNGCTAIASGTCYNSCKGMVGNTAVLSGSSTTAFSSCQVYYATSTPTPSASGNGGNNYSYSSY